MFVDLFTITGKPLQQKHLLSAQLGTAPLGHPLQYDTFKYMLFACGISNYSTGLFHLMNHAFFKALLFLSAGSIIHAIADEQDMRKYGGLIKSLPFSYSMTLI